MSQVVRSPVAGVVVALDDVPDPVFSGRIVGPGVAVNPEYTAEGGSAALAPVSGTVAKIHPHAYVITASGGRSVLVHLGLDTVSLEGRGFTVLAAEGEAVSASSPGRPLRSRQVGSTRSFPSSPWRGRSPPWPRFRRGSGSQPATRS